MTSTLRKQKGHKARTLNSGIKAWIKFVKKVQKEEKINYPAAIKRAKERKDSGEKWMTGGQSTVSQSATVSMGETPATGSGTLSTVMNGGQTPSNPSSLAEENMDAAELNMGVAGEEIGDAADEEVSAMDEGLSAMMGGRRRRRTMRKSRGKSKSQKKSRSARRSKSRS